MTRDELELMWDLKRVCTQVPGFVLEFMSGDSSAEAERAFAYQLDDVVERILRHATAKEHLVLDGSALVLPGQPGPCAIEAGGGA